MDLRLLGRAAWKHKAMMLVALGVGFILLFLALYRIELVRDAEDRPRVDVVDRSFTSYESEVQLIVQDAEFSVGRAGKQADAFRRAIEVAPTYAFLALSDPVRERLEALVGPLDVGLDCGAIAKSPVLVVTVVGVDKDRVTLVAQNVGPAFQEYLIAEQDASGVTPDDRMSVKPLAAPTPPFARVIRGTQVAVLGFFTPLVLALGIAYIREGLRRERQSEGQVDESVVARVGSP